MMSIASKQFKLTLLFIFLAELLSLCGFLLPDFGRIAFWVIIILTLLLSLKDLRFGVWIILAELFIGSKGYLFDFEFGGVIVSIRIALWLVVMAVWFGRFFVNFLNSLKARSRLLAFKEFKKNPLSFIRMCRIRSAASNHYFSYFVILFIFIIWGVVNGFLNHNSFNNIFFDFNGWLYFALIFPFFSVIKGEESVKSVWQIFMAAIIWLSAKTFFLLFIFSHNMAGMTAEIYRWVRVTGVGEITQMQGGFYRIFIQSQIFVLIGFFAVMMLIWRINTPAVASSFVKTTADKKAMAGKNPRIANNINNKSRNYWKLLTSGLLLLTLFLSVILISFSRSFWVGLIAGLFAVCFIFLFVHKISWKKFLSTGAILILVFIISVGLIAAVVKFPYPSPTGGFNTADLLSKRARQITGEAGVSSRWNLLPELWSAIKDAPILGQGFGATVTYESSDPRILESSPTGEYTTYAFEWGWLDIWLKLGIFGLLSYIILVGVMIYDGIKNTYPAGPAHTGLIIGLAVIAVVSFFSPYLNHPLGIGYLLLVAALLTQPQK